MSQKSKKNHDNTLKQKTLKGLLWVFSGTSVEAILQLIVMIFLARLLTPDEFGVIGAAMIVITFSTIFSTLGVGPAIVQRYELTMYHIRTGFTTTLLFGFILSIIIYVSSPLIASLFRIDDLIPILKVLSILFIIQSLGVISQSLLQRELKFKVLAWTNAIGYGIGYGIFAIIFAAMGFGVWSLVLGHILMTVIKTVLFIYLRPHNMYPQMNVLALKELLYFGNGFTIGKIGNYIAGQGDNFVVARWLGTEALGLYGRAYQLMVMPATFFGQVLDKVLFPSMSQIQNDSKRLTNIYQKGVSIIAFLVLPLSSLLFFLAPEIILILLGEDWLSIVIPFQILAVGLIFRTSYKVSNTLTKAAGAVYRRAWRQYVYAILVFLGSFLGMKWGIEGVAIGVTIAIFIFYILMAQLCISITLLSWKKYLIAHLPGLWITLVTSGQTYLIVTTVRELNLNPLIIISIAMLSFILTVVILIKYSPKFLLGSVVITIVDSISTVLSRKAKKSLAKKKIDM